MHAAPGHTRVGLRHLDVPHGRLDLVAHEPLFVETGPGLDVLRFDEQIADRHAHQRVGGQQIRAAEQQAVDRVSRALVVFQSCVCFQRMQTRMRRSVFQDATRMQTLSFRWAGGTLGRGFDGPWQGV